MLVAAEEERFQLLVGLLAEVRDVEVGGELDLERVLGPSRRLPVFEAVRQKRNVSRQRDPAPLACESARTSLLRDLGEPLALDARHEVGEVSPFNRPTAPLIARGATIC